LRICQRQAYNSGQNMDGPPALKKDWVVTQESFDRLLRQLDPDRERAGERYEQIRQKLTKFFQWRGCASPEDYADRTMDRVARKVGEGAEIHAQDVYLFFHGVAINVLREHWKEAQKANVKSLEESPAAQNAGENPTEVRERETEQGEREQKLECLDGCVQRLPAQQLTLITQYHQDQGGAKIAKRNELAKQLKIPLNALRIRAFRIRSELETCVSECVARQA
jgi:DNA-directed RNA polymerase specialized sigma24 family protein